MNKLYRTILTLILTSLLQTHFALADTKSYEICFDEGYSENSKASSDRSYDSSKPLQKLQVKKCIKVGKQCDGTVVVGKDNGSGNPPPGCDAKCKDCPTKNGEKMYCKYDGRKHGYTCQYDGE